MKKIITYVALFALIMVMMTTSVYASTEFADVDDENLACAARNLLEMGILSPSKNLGVDEKITKAEMAQLLIAVSNNNPTSKDTKSYKEYEDVTTDYWAWGYIDAISRLKYTDNIVNDDYFYPNEYVTYSETIVYVLNLLGYSDVIESKTSNGDITKAYIDYANMLKLLKNTVGSTDREDEITKGNLCIILWNALNTQVWRVFNSSGSDVTGGDILLKLRFPDYTPTYNVELNDYEGGIIEVNNKEVLPKGKMALSIMKGEKYTLTFIPDDRYEFGYVKVDGHIYRNRTVTNNKLTIEFDDCYDVKIDLYFDEVDIPNESETTKLKFKNQKNNFTGKEIELILEGFDSNIMTITGNKGVSVGKYEATVEVKNPNLYQISYGESYGSSLKIDWEIVKSFVPTIDVIKKEFEYNGKEQEVDAEYNPNLVKVTGNKATDVGEYKAVYSLIYKNECEWEDGGNEDIIVNWNIVTSDLIETKIIQNNGGKIETENVFVKKGENQFFTIKPNSGYQIVDVLVDGESMGPLSKYTLKNVTEEHQIEAIFEKIVEKHEEIFLDVNENEWYYESVNFAVNKGLFKGVSENEFAPDITMNRAMLVTVLYRLDGEKNTNYKHEFNDIENNSYYERAVNWATDKKIISGVSENEFAPSDEITREQLVVMLYRYATLKKLNTNKKANLNVYSDNSEVSDYAKDAMAWAVKEEYINGRTNTILAPQETATRAEVAAILMRFNEDL